MQQSLSSNNHEKLARSILGKAQNNSILSRALKPVLVILRILAGMALLLLSIQGINTNGLLAGFRSADLPWLLLSMFMVLLGLGLKLWRWAWLVRNYHIRTSLARLFSAYFVGQAANVLLPFRGGEVIRLGYFFDDKHTIPEAASTILLEKYLDLIALTVCSLIVSYYISLDNVFNVRQLLLPVTILVTLLFMAAILLGPSVWKRVRERKLLPGGLTQWLDRWMEASSWLRVPSLVIPAGLLTIVIWVVMWLTNLALFKSLGLALGGTAGGLVLVFVYIGLLPALMPGNIGPFYFFARLALLPFGIVSDQAVIFAVVLHSIVTLPPLLGGAVGLFIRSPYQTSS